MKYLLMAAGFLVGAIFYVSHGTPLMDQMMEQDIDIYMAQPFTTKIHWYLIDKGFFSEAILGAAVGFIYGFLLDIKAKYRSKEEDSAQ